MDSWNFIKCFKFSISGHLSGKAKLSMASCYNIDLHIDLHKYSIKKMGFENCKNATQFSFMQHKNISLAPITTPMIDFGLNTLATSRVEQTIRISVVMRPLRP